MTQLKQKVVNNHNTSSYQTSCEYPTQNIYYLKLQFDTCYKPSSSMSIEYSTSRSNNTRARTLTRAHTHTHTHKHTSQTSFQNFNNAKFYDLVAATTIVTLYKYNIGNVPHPHTTCGCVAIPD